jgi:hypothetical protein
MSNAGAAQALGVAVKSVSKWRQFAAERLAGLEDAAPVGRQKARLVLDDAERAELIRWARPPRRSWTHWQIILRSFPALDTSSLPPPHRRLPASLRDRLSNHTTLVSHPWRVMSAHWRRFRLIAEGQPPDASPEAQFGLTGPR